MNRLWGGGDPCMLSSTPTTAATTRNPAANASTAVSVHLSRAPGSTAMIALRLLGLRIL